MVGGHLDPGQAPVADSAVRARAQAGQTATGWTDSGPIPSGRTPPETLGGRTGAAAGFVAGPGFDVDERRAADREPTGWTAGRPASGPSPIQAPADPRRADETAGGRRPRGRTAVRDAPGRARTMTRSRPQVAAAAGRRGRTGQGGRSGRSGRAGQSRAERPQRRTGRRRSRRKIMIGAGLAVVVVGAAAVVESGVFSSGPAHVLVTPDKLGTYVRPAATREADERRPVAESKSSPRARARPATSSRPSTRTAPAPAAPRRRR